MEVTKLNGELENLIKATQDGKIPWTSMPNNPIQIKWDRVVAGETYQVTIQGQNIGNPNPVNIFYFFTIMKMPPPQQILLLQINTQQEPAFKDLLAKLYAEATVSAKQSSGFLLNKLLKDI